MASISFQNMVGWFNKRYSVCKNDDSWRFPRHAKEIESRPKLATAEAKGGIQAPIPVSSNPDPPKTDSSPPPEPSEPPNEDPLTPIQYDMHRREYQFVSTQETFDGFRMEASKTVTPQLQASHTLMLGTTLREGGYMYQFGPTYSSKDGNLFVFSRFGTDGVTNGRIIKRFPHKSQSRTLPGSEKKVVKDQVSELKANFASSLTDEQSNVYEFGCSTVADTWASSLTAAWQGTWFVNGSFSQVIAPKLHLGGELTWIASQGSTTASIGGRYVHKNNFWSGQISRSPDFKSPFTMLNNIHGVKLQYLRKVNDRLSLGAEFDTNTDMESAMRMAYEYSFKNVARVQGMIDTAGKVSMFCQDQTGFGVSGFIDFWKGDYKFGFIMHMVPQQEGGPSE